MRFWDSSALVPLIVTQDFTARMISLYEQDGEVIVWWGTRVECDSAVARLEREQALAPSEVTVALARLDALAKSWHEVQAQDLLRELARRLLRTHTLRAGDALQLASAIVAAENDPASLSFVCLDDRLVLAAQREGLTVVGASVP